MQISSGGLRLEEVVQFRQADLQPEQQRLLVDGGKGKKAVVHCINLIKFERNFYYGY